MHAQYQPPKRSAWRTWHTVVVSILGSVIVMFLAIPFLNSLSASEEDHTETTGPPEGFDAYLDGLDAINPGIRSGREDQPILNDAENLCATISQGADEETLIQGTIARFGVNEAEDIVTEDVAAQILALTREHCDIIRPE